jgi:hypothetical protein
MAKKQSNILRVKLVKSGIGYSVRTKRTLKALGSPSISTRWLSMRIMRLCADADKGLTFN